MEEREIRVVRGINGGAWALAFLSVTGGGWIQGLIYLELNKFSDFSRLASVPKATVQGKGAHLDHPIKYV